MDIKELFTAAWAHAASKTMQMPGRHSKGRSLRGKARIAKRRAKRKSN